jgi:type III restriction enzyme
MMEHFWERASGYEVHVSRGFTEIKKCNYTISGQAVQNVRETVEDPARIKQLLFGGFRRCLYPLLRFDSGTERRFALILDRDSMRWFKPAKGQFLIDYKFGNEQPEYIPDFVAETSDSVLMVETKARDELESTKTQAKAGAALQWCSHASRQALSVGSKPWRYLLVPHDAVNESAGLRDMLRFEIRESLPSRLATDA